MSSNENERWLNTRIGAIRMQRIFQQQAEEPELPQKLQRQLLKFNPAETNVNGETLVFATVVYISDRKTQVPHDLNDINDRAVLVHTVQYLNMLIRAGCDPSQADRRQRRTPLMMACILRNEIVAEFLIDAKVDLKTADRLGNTALMYAVIYGQTHVVVKLVRELTKQWSFNVFRARNVMGYTAEDLALKNEQYACSKLLKRERLHMLQRMHRQLALIHLSASLKGWTGYNTVYKAKQAFLSRKPKKNMKHADVAPTLSFPPILPGTRINVSDVTDSLAVTSGYRIYRSASEEEFRELLSPMSHHLPTLNCSR